jgi:hypothetical protein
MVCAALVRCQLASAQLAPQADRAEKALAVTATARPAPREHAFWDATNLALFGGIVAVRAVDYTSTRHFRERGVDEGLLSNSIVDNKPAFVAIEAGVAAASIGISYWLHRREHHRLERWMSIGHIGVGTFGDIRNYTLKRAPVIRLGP